jgi:hypothetical protein
VLFERRRQHPRIFVSIPVRIQGFGFECLGETVELGAGGMALAKVSHLVVSQPVTATISLPTGEVKVEGVVWWKRDKLIGIRFDPAAGKSKPIENFVAGKLAESAQP